MPTVKLNRAIKYRAYPTEEQTVLLAKTFGCVRFVWNHMLTDAQTFLNFTTASTGNRCLSLSATITASAWNIQAAAFS